MPQAASAQAPQPWPERTIQAIVPFAAGAANDIVGRIVLEQVSKQVNQPIVVENRPGAGGTIGVTAVGKAQPNGHTLLVHSSSFSAAYSLYKSLPYDTLNDFTAVVALGKTPTVLVTSPGKGFKTAGDLIAAARAKPGAMNFASAGIGSVSHLAAERFRLSAGIDAQHIPFRGPNEAFTEVMAGRIDFYFLPLAPALPLVKEGQLVALAVSTDTRATALPDVPTTMELGLKDFGLSVLDWDFRPGENPARHRRPHPHGIGQGHAGPGGAGAARQGRQRADADDGGRIREVLSRRRARDRQADAAGRGQAGRLEVLGAKC